jgi:shikimate kinase
MAEFHLLYLVGFMGSGKSTVGRRLAELLGWTFVDLDQEIEKLEGMPISEIFSSRGEDYFRLLERRELGRASAGESTVVAVGGGAFCCPENAEVIRRTGFSIWLDAPVELLFERCGSCPATRPLFAGLEDMSALLQCRMPAYSQADLRVQVSGLDVDELARRILGEFRQGAVSR